MKLGKTYFYIIGGLTLFIYIILVMSGKNALQAFTGALSLSFVIYTLVWFLFDKWFWKRHVILSLCGIENFSGKWSGTLHSSYGSGVEKKTKVDISQTFSRIVITTKTDEIESVSFLAKWEKSMINKKKEIFYMYRTDPKGEHNDKNPVQYGAARIRFDDEQKTRLRIEYWTNRETVGYMLLNKV